MYIESIKFKREENSDWERGYYIGETDNCENSVILDDKYQPLSKNDCKGWEYITDIENGICIKCQSGTINHKAYMKAEENMKDYILCENNNKASVGDKIKVVGRPQRFFYDTKIEVTGIIREIKWYEDEEYYGFTLENTDKFYIENCDKIYLVDTK